MASDRRVTTLGTVTTLSDSAVAPLPSDAIRTGEAIALLAGKTLTQNSTAYIRHQGRLVRSAKHGRLTEYKLGPGRPRYWSRTEVLALRDSLASDGFTDKPPSNYHRRTVEAIVKRAERDGLITIKVSAELAGVTIGAVRKWIERGRFGARKIGGLWFLETAQVAAYQRPAPRQPPETVACALCGESLMLRASHVRRARAAAEAAGGDELLVFCSECWPTPEARSLAHRRRVWRRGYSSPGRAAGLERQWAEGKRDVEAHTERTKQSWRSPTATVMRVEKSVQARHGHPLSPESAAVIRGRALSRAQRNSDRSRIRRGQEQRMAEMWTAGYTAKEIAEELNTTVSNVKEMRRRQGSPQRQPGRRPRE
jgi:hypothetical protein